MSASFPGAMLSPLLCAVLYPYQHPFSRGGGSCAPSDPHSLHHISQSTQPASVSVLLFAWRWLRSAQKPAQPPSYLAMLSISCCLIV